MLTFNTAPLQHIRTVEVRMHGGTLDAGKILLWVSLWQQLLWAAEHPQREIQTTADCSVIHPGTDLLALARDYLTPFTQLGQQQFIERLRRRRNEIVTRWAQVPELAPWVEISGRWH
jgi:hypothetical protein